LDLFLDAAKNTVCCSDNDSNSAICLTWHVASSLAEMLSLFDVLETPQTMTLMVFSAGYAWNTSPGKNTLVLQLGASLIVSNVTAFDRKLDSGASENSTLELNAATRAAL